MSKPTNIYNEYQNLGILDLNELLLHADTREERLFYQRLLTLKMGIAQEKVVGKELL